MVRRCITTLAMAIAMLCLGCAGTIDRSYTGAAGTVSTGAAVGRSPDTTGSIKENTSQNRRGLWNTPCGWDPVQNFGANPALGSPVPPGFNCLGGDGGDE